MLKASPRHYFFPQNLRRGLMNQQGMQSPPSSGPARRLAQRIIDSMGFGRKTIETQAIVDAAIAQSGRRDFGDTAFVANLDHLLLALEHGRSLSTDGRTLLRQFLVDLLASRAAVVAYDRQHPNVFRNEVVAPIVIVGLPASGITPLQQVLIQDGDNRAPTVWETVSPVPPPSAFSFEKDRRIDDADLQLATLNRRLPLAAMKVDARAAQDCAMILAGNATSELFAAALNAPHYRHWMQSADMLASYQWHRQMLQHLQSACLGQRWVLKSAQHLLHLRTLLAVYPDTCVVFVHREPADALAEYWPLCLQSRKTLQLHVDTQSQLHDEIVYWAYAMDTATTALAGLPGVNVVHVSWDGLQRRPLKVVEEIYAACGQQLAPQAFNRIDTYCGKVAAQRSRREQAPWRESAPATRLLDANTLVAQTDRAFANYIGYFGHYFR